MAETWLQALGGQFVVFDGPDGCGKSTQLQRFADHLADHGIAHCTVRDPGGTEIGEQIRRILLNPAHERMDLRCEMLLYMASRAQLMTEKIRPALREGRCVLADRFICSTLAYQGAAGGLAEPDIRQVGRIAMDSRWPDWVIIFDIDEQTAARRLVGHKPDHSKFIHIDQPTLFSDRIEIRGLEYQKRVRQGFLDQARADPDHHLVIDARPDPDTVFHHLCLALKQRLG